MRRHCWEEAVSVELRTRLFRVESRRGSSPAIVVVAVDVEDLLALDTEHTVARRHEYQLQSS